MQKPHQLALLCAGPISQTRIGKLPGLAHHLGPVKANSLRVASRVVNTLRAGYPVSDFDALTSCPILLVNPATKEYVPSADDQLAGSGVSLAGLNVVLFDSEVESDDLSSLRNAGAHVSSFGPMPDLPGHYMFEGHRPAGALLKRVFRIEPRNFIQFPPGGKRSYFQRRNTCYSSLIGLMSAAERDFKNVGLHSQQVKAALEEVMTGTMRAYFRSNTPKITGSAPGRLRG